MILRIWDFGRENFRISVDFSQNYCAVIKTHRSPPYYSASRAYLHKIQPC